MWMTYKTTPETSGFASRQLRARRRRLAHQFPDVDEVISGSVQSQRRRCGKDGCRCTRGELHGPYLYLSVRAGKRTRLLYVPAELADSVRRRMTVTERVQSTLAEISAINLELLVRGELD